MREGLGYEKRISLRGMRVEMERGRLALVGGYEKLRVCLASLRGQNRRSIGCHLSESGYSFLV